MIKIGHRVVVAINGDHASLRLTRRADTPDQINFFVYTCDLETAAGPTPPVPVASGWFTLAQARALSRALSGRG
jgi:acyl dehydratase